MLHHFTTGINTQHDIRKMAGVVGFEPTKCQSQSLVPYRLATPQKSTYRGYYSRKNASFQASIQPHCKPLKFYLEFAV